MRADRLVATLLILQARDNVTARQLAAELEISEKTARRDLEALAMAGIPVYAQAGRGGGWRLLGGARTDLSGLNAAEARTLFLTIGAGSGGGAEVASAVRKLTRALPESFRADAEAAARAVIVDTNAWGASAAPAAPPEFLEPLQRAVIERRTVALGYTDRTRATSERTVRPLGLVSRGPIWYLVADTDNGRRTFRLNRMRSVDVTDERFERPTDFDLEAVWREVSATVAEMRLQVRATVRIKAAYVRGLRAQFGSDMTLAELGSTASDAPEAEAAEEVVVIVGGPSAGSIAEHLAGWGSSLEVIEPPEVRHALAQTGAELVELYSRRSSNA